jgi:hypothetical protein
MDEIIGEYLSVIQPISQKRTNDRQFMVNSLVNYEILKPRTRT